MSNQSETAFPSSHDEAWAAITASQEGGKLFRQMAEHIGDVFWMTDPQKRRMLYVSPTYEAIWGRTCRSLYDAPDSWLEAVHVDERERVRQAALNNQIAGVYDEVYRVLRPDGGVRWIRDRAFPIRDCAGRIYRITGVAADITAQKATEDATARLAAIVQNSNDAIIGRNLDGTITSWNPGAERLLGYTAAEALGRPVTFTLPPGGAPLLRANTDKLLRGEFVAPYESQRMAKDGRLIDVLTSHSPVKDSAGKVIAAATILHDISERKRAEAERNRLAQIVEHSNDAIVSRAPDGTIQSWNAAAERMFGWSAQEAIGQPITIITPPERRGTLRPIIERVMAGELFGAIESSHRRKDGARIETSVSLSAMKNAAGHIEFISFFYRDITTEKRAQERLNYLSHHDVLTGLPNRGLFQDRLERAVAQARRRGETLGVLMVNIDRFGKVNESLGVGGGDELLCAVAQRMRASLRNADTIARFGGNEFAVLVEGVAGAGEVIVVAEKLNQVYAAPFTVSAQEVFVAASIGGAVFPNGTDAPHVLLQHAETAMREIKSDGGNGYLLYNSEVKRDNVQHIDLERRLRRALDNGELELHYQPKVNSATGAVQGAEALVRWRHRGLGLVSPAHFIPIAEETGLILPIGEWVLNSACREASVWRKEGFELNVAVNLSPRQFRHTNLFGIVVAALDASGLDPQDLELEITETVALSRPEHAESLLKRLRALGVKIALDDFGTGHSSLSHLRRLRLDAVKIDRSFVQNIATNAQDRAIVSGVTALAHNLGMRITAEGVEDGLQLETIRQCGCDDYQGYHFSRPLPAAEFRALLARTQAKVNTLNWAPEVGDLTA